MDNYEETENEELNLGQEIVNGVAVTLAGIALGYAALIGTGLVIGSVIHFRDKRKQAKIDKEFVSIIEYNHS